MAAFIRVETQTGHEIVINVEQIVSIEPFLADMTMSVIRLSVSQSIRNQELGIMETAPQSYVVKATFGELQDKMIKASKEFFA